MASKYSDDYIRQVAAGQIEAPNSYVARLARNYKPGISRAQARGHARKQFGEQPVSIIKGIRSTVEKIAFKPPKIEKRFQRLPNGTRIVNTRSAEQLGRTLFSNMKGLGAGKLNRIYFQVFNPDTGKMVPVYYGKAGRKGFHGITVEELMRRVESKMDSGDYESFEDALWDTIVDDAADADYVEDNGGGALPPSFTQVSMYIRAV